MAVAVSVLAWPFFGRIRSGLRIPRRELLVVVLAGLLFAADIALWTTGVAISGAAIPTLLTNTAPIWVGLGALVFFRERLKALFWIGLLVAMLGTVGVLGLSLLREVSFGLGSLFGLLAGIFYGGYFLLTQRGRQRLDTFTFFWLCVFTSAVGLGLLCIVTGQRFAGYPLRTYLCFLALGLISQVGGYLCVNYALGPLPASVVAPLMLGQPVVTALLAGPLLGEHLSPWEVGGGVAVLLGAYLVGVSRQHETRSCQGHHRADRAAPASWEVHEVDLEMERIDQALVRNESVLERLRGEVQERQDRMQEVQSEIENLKDERERNARIRGSDGRGFEKPSTARTSGGKTGGAGKTRTTGKTTANKSRAAGTARSGADQSAAAGEAKADSTRQPSSRKPDTTGSQEAGKAKPAEDEQK